jgi:hypothetical protein
MLKVDLKALVEWRRPLDLAATLADTRFGAAIWTGVGVLILFLGVAVALYMGIGRGKAIDSLAVLPLVNVQ